MWLFGAEEGGGGVGEGAAEKTQGWWGWGGLMQSLVETRLVGAAVCEMSQSGLGRAKVKGLEG